MHQSHPNLRSTLVNTTEISSFMLQRLSANTPVYNAIQVANDIFSTFITPVVDLTHCRGITRAWHEVSRPGAQPCQGQFHYHVLLCVFCSHFHEY